MRFEKSASSKKLTMNPTSTTAAAKKASLKFRSLRSIRARAQFPVNADEDFLEDVLSLVLVPHEADDVAKEWFLNTPEELIQSLVAAGLCLQHPPAFPLRLIGHALIRPTD